MENLHDDDREMSESAVATPGALGHDGSDAGLLPYIVPITPVAPDTQNGDVCARFNANEDLLALPVCTGERPVGLIHRHDFTGRLAHRYGWSLYEKKPVHLLMDHGPLVVPQDLCIDKLQHLIATDRPSALTRGFIVVHGERYVGMGTALSLLQASVRLNAQRNLLLTNALAEAESAGRVKSRMLANVSHELRTPLNAIIGFSEMMTIGTHGPLPKRYADYAADIHASGTHLLGIINALLDIAKAEADAHQLHEASVNPKLCLTDALHFVQLAADQKGLTLKLAAAADLPMLRADERMLRQIMLNLLSNAVKFTTPGGYVTAYAHRGADGGLALGVRDTGVGMSPEDLKMALMPFGQVANEFTRSHDGTGLGLPLAKAFATLHGATLAIDSAPGRGTDATVHFPPARTIGIASATAA